MKEPYFFNNTHAIILINIENLKAFSKQINLFIIWNFKREEKIGCSLQNVSTSLTF